MRLTIVTLGSRGAVQPYVALGLGLQAAGHQVTVASYATSRDLICRHGLGFAPITTNPDERTACERGGRWLVSSGNPLRAIRRLHEVMAPTLTRMVADCEVACRHADAILYSTLGWSRGRRHHGGRPTGRARLGAGPPPVPRRRLTAGRLAAAIDAATCNARMRHRAASLGECIRGERGVERAVEIIQDWLRRSGR